MRNNVIRYFRSFSLRQRFLVAPLLGLVVCSLLAAAFVYESQRQNVLFTHITEQGLKSFNRYADVFVDLTEQHTAIYDLLYSAGKIDEATLYDQAKQHLYQIQEAIRELEQALPPTNSSMGPDFSARRNELSADGQAYRKAINAAVKMATVNLALAPQQLILANRRFSLLSRSFARILDLEQRAINVDIAARVRQSQISSTAIALIGILVAALLLFLSQVLSRVLSRSIETQIGLLTELGTQAGARSVRGGGDEVDRMTHAIAAFRQSLLELRESERRFSDMMRNVELVSVMLDSAARITYCNEYLLRLTGWQYEEVIGCDWFALFIAPEIHQLKNSFFPDILANRPGAMHDENEILTRSGERRLIRWNNSVLRSGAGTVIGTASIGEDITERKEAEARIAYLNRVYTMLSGINALIVRARDRDELFKEACRIAVEDGGFRMALVSMIDQNTMTMVPVASRGKDEELLATITNILSSSDSAQRTMCARAIREKRAIVSNASQRDHQVVFSAKYAEAGVRSMVLFPLIVSDEAVGVLGLYASEVEFFHEEEMKLLTQLAGDVGFAIDYIAKQERLNYLAYYDVLTGLANRCQFLDRLAQYILKAIAGGHELALFVIDLERFKNINDSLGRPAGDALLQRVAEWLVSKAGDINLVARVGVDQFAVLLPQIMEGQEVAPLLEKWIEAFLNQPFRLNDAVFRIAAKVGVALFPNDGANADTLFKNAEFALKKTKASGDRFLFYTHKMTEAMAGRLTLENQLRHALDAGEFVLHYQPKINLASGKLTSAEALIRWEDPHTGLVPPGRFIPILEETGMIYEVGRWALRRAIEDYLRWRAAGLPAVRIAVNVSPLQLRNHGFVAEIAQAIGVDANAAAGLELEITESLIMEDVAHSIASLKAIRAMGVSIAIDDFGTGFSSLSYLAKLPVDTLKIDRSFIIDMTTGPEGRAIVSTIIELSHALNLKVVAEGVETEQQSRLLRSLNCDEMQGYLFSKPVPADLFETRFLAPMLKHGALDDVENQVLPPEILCPP